MAKKKEIKVTSDRQGRARRIVIVSGNAELMNYIEGAIDTAARLFDADIVNMANPFGRRRTIGEGEKASDEDIAKVKELVTALGGIE